MPKVVIDAERCKQCMLCVRFCPRESLRAGNATNLKGYHPPDVVKPEACTACHLCEILCPDFAIGVEEISYTEGNHGG